MPEGASRAATQREAERFAKEFEGDTTIENYSFYVGQGAPRFVLTTEPKLPTNNYAQFVFVAKSVEEREQLNKKIKGAVFPRGSKMYAAM